MRDISTATERKGEVCRVTVAYGYAAESARWGIKSRNAKKTRGIA